tara:strand:- start:2490 stop:3050 length:561 start_codon:yes stop_codon:yes gene_type:complete
MRIISGKFKGKNIQYLKNSITRPLKDSVKENIFNILAHSNILGVRIEGSNILDLYSGIGSFGIEAISRDAKKVTFVEQDEKASKVLQENLLKLSMNNKSKVINDKIESILKKENKEKFDIFFLDPPFLDKAFIENLKTIKDKQIFKKKHIILIHRKSNSEDKFKNIFSPLIIKKYGKSKIIFGRFN